MTYPNIRDDRTAAMDADDNTLADIPIGNDEAGVSLPNENEIRFHITRVPHSSSKMKSIILWAFALLALLTVGIVVVIALTSDNDSSSPRRATEDQVISYFAEQAIAVGELSDSEENPHRLAARWLSDDDEANLAVPDVGIDEKEGYDYLFRYVMALNFFSMGGPEGNWQHHWGFLSETNVCRWSGWWITPRGGRYPAGIFCSANSPDVPAFLFLGQNGLSGTIPTENGLLTTLQVFDMKANEVKGTIPTELCQLTRLTNLYLGYNKITGPIPECFDQLKALEVLFLSDNQLSGTVPAQMADLSKLESLYMDDNVLSGDIGVFDDFVSLLELFVEDNVFSGSLTPSSFNKLTLLERLDLSNNNIMAGLPREMLSLPNLEVLDVSKNRLTGPLPSIPADSKIKFLALHDNYMNGAIKSALRKMEQLTHLDLSTNSFHGVLHSELADLTNLKYLFLADNPLEEGTIPESFARLSNLEELSLKRTNRNGTLPDFIGDFENLILLDLDHNHFTGRIPESYGQLSRLQFLLLNRNEITGPLPDSFASLVQLRAVVLDGTGLSGTLDTLCSIPAFADPRGEEVILADCGGNNPDITCSCGSCVCCDPSASDECSDPIVTNLDGIWENSFARAVYRFGNLTGF